MVGERDDVVPVGSSAGVRQAWVDESEPGQPARQASYVLAAGICRDTDADEVREKMQGLLLRGQRKLHWHAESSKRRQQIIDAVADLHRLQHVIVVRTATSGERPERRRRLCFERLAYELNQRGVSQARLEARASKQNQRDRDMLDALRARKVIGYELRIEHVPGPADPGLWVPDAVCGAAGLHALAHDDTLWKPLADRAVLITV